MLKVLLTSVSIGLVLAACSQDQPKPDIWTVNYNVPFDAMVACLAAPPAGAFKTYAPDYTQDGVARIVFIPESTPQSRSAYVVTRMIGNVSQVSWQRFGSVSQGLDWLDAEARTRANRCGSA